MKIIDEIYSKIFNRYLGDQSPIYHRAFLREEIDFIEQLNGDQRKAYSNMKLRKSLYYKNLFYRFYLHGVLDSALFLQKYQGKENEKALLAFSRELRKIKVKLKNK